MRLRCPAIAAQRPYGSLANLLKTMESDVMRLVVINTKADSYRVYEDRDLVAEYKAEGLQVTKQDVEDMRLYTPPAAEQE